MKNVMLVDDEYLVRERLKLGVDWSFYGMRVAAEAENGEDALEVLEQQEIHLAIIDINMPIIDGLEFARLAGARYPALKMVMLTGYGTFDYARSALQAGARDYLLKPIHTAEFKVLLEKIAAELAAQDEDQEEHERVLQQIQESKAIVRDRWIRQWLAGVVPYEPDFFQLHCPSLGSGSCVVLTAALDRADEVRGSAGDVERSGDVMEEAAVELVEEAGGSVRDEERSGKIAEEAAVERAAREKSDWPAIAAMLLAGLSGYPRLEWINDAEGKRLHLLAELSSEGFEGGAEAIDALGSTSAAEALRPIEQLEQACRAGIAAVRERTGRTVTFGLSRTAEDWQGAAEAARQAAHAVTCRILRGGGQFIRYDELSLRPSSSEAASVREKLLVLLRLGNPVSVSSAIEAWLTDCTHAAASLEQLYTLLGELLASLRLYAAENECDIEDALPSSLLPYSLVQETESADRLREWMQERAIIILARTAQARRSTPALLVEKAKAYIDQAYADPELDLNGIASHIAVNPSYLSRIFKPAAGYSVVEYVTLCRMRRSKELLEQGIKNLTYVAEAVGYADAHYFSKCFKKQYGVPPSHFSSRSM